MTCCRGSSQTTSNLTKLCLRQLVNTLLMGTLSNQSNSPPPPCLCMHTVHTNSLSLSLITYYAGTPHLLAVGRFLEVTEQAVSDIDEGRT